MNEFLTAIDMLEKDKGIDKETIFSAIETSLLTSCRRIFGEHANLSVSLSRKDGSAKVMSWKSVVAEVTDPAIEISLEEAKEKNLGLGLGDRVDEEITPKNFGRIAAQNAAQVIRQKLHEAERGVQYNEFKGKEMELVTGTILHRERKGIIIEVGNMDVQLPTSEQVPNDNYALNRRIKVLVSEVRNSTKGPFVTVSRRHPALIKRLFEQEVPEIQENIVVVKSIARDAGSRAKMAVFSRDPQVDPQGACIGNGGSRVNAVVNELNGEKIDIVVWNASPAKFIQAALAPAKVDRVEVDKDSNSATVIVPDDQLSLAIGKEGQNARLAARLTKYKIDIKSASQATEAAKQEESDYDFEFVFDDEGDDDFEIVLEDE